MDFHIDLHGRPALTIQDPPDQEPVILSRHPSCAGLSASWRGNEIPAQIIVWLSALLPENGKLERWMESTRDHFGRLGQFHRIHLPESVLMAHSDAEYPGAVSVRLDGEAPLAAHDVSDYRALSEEDVGDLLTAELQLSGRLKGSPQDRFAHVSLSGTRPKISLAARSGTPDGGWLQGAPGQLHTWVIKIEDRRRNPGEAGVESVCQNALRLAGLPAARTFSRMLSGHQCVLSERSDRRMRDGRILPVHQEDYRQASGTLLGKFRDRLAAPRDEWPVAYALLREHGDANAWRGLLRFLAASAMLAHCDLHRGNLGFVISDPADGAKRISLAPAYDVSSGVGTTFGRRLEFPIAQQEWPERIGARQWTVHAKACGLQVAEALSEVADVCRRLPDAFSDAWKASATHDENHSPMAVERRCRATLKHVADRADFFLRGMDRELTRSLTPR